MSTIVPRELDSDNDVENQEEGNFSEIATENTPLLAPVQESVAETVSSPSHRSSNSRSNQRNNSGNFFSSITGFFGSNSTSAPSSTPRAEVASSSNIVQRRKHIVRNQNQEDITMVVDGHVSESCHDDEEVVLLAEPLSHAIPFHNPFDSQHRSFQNSETAVISHLLICSLGILFLLILFVL